MAYIFAVLAVIDAVRASASDGICQVWFGRLAAEARQD
jgi:hypothetical protein